MPGSGSSEQSGERTFGVPECCGRLVEALNWSHLDGCCSRVSRPFGVAYSRALGVQGCCLLRFSSWGPEAWNPILICHCISEVRRPLWKRGGGDARLPLREAAV